MSLPTITKPARNPSPKNSQNKLLNIITVIGLSILFIIFSLSWQPSKGADTPECRAIYMYPSYAKIEAFDESHTKFASKYDLYLYREQGKDKTPGENGNYDVLDGIPVLFIPGNAGSYKQVRSIAAESAMVFHYHRENPEYLGKNFDFFAADFNEDFTAFHGRTMLDQAEYLNDAIKFILSLYVNKPTPPSSIIVIGHSMGGVVSRVMMTLPNYVEGSINTIITLSAPHAAAPATFDGDIMKIYAAADTFWRAGFSGKDEASTAKVRFKDVSLISITGGAEDSILPADYTTLTGLVPPTNGFTVYTTGIPSVWTPIDHLAIVWCDQLRKTIASVLYDIADPKVTTKTLPLKERMSKFRRKLLTGFEDYSTQDFSAVGPKRSISIELNDTNSVKSEVSVINEAAAGKYHIIPVSSIQDPIFTVLSSSRSPISQDNSGLLKILLCSETSTHRYECTDVSSDLYKVPNALHGVKSLSESSYGGDKLPFYAAQLPPSTLNSFSHIIVKGQLEMGFDDFTEFGLFSSSSHNLKVHATFFQLLFGSTITVPGNRPLTYDIEYHNAWSSIVSYTLHLSTDSATTKFSPFMRQWVGDPFETKWHLNLDETKYISLHGIAPFTPFKVERNPLHVQLFSGKGNEQAQIVLRINLLQSLRLLVLRYRLALASFPIFIITLVLAIQFNIYFDSDVFPSFQTGLRLLAGKSIYAMSALSALSSLSATSLFHSLYYLFDPVAQTSPVELGSNVHVNPYFLGLEETYLFLLAPLFYLIALALVRALDFIVTLCLNGLPYAFSLHKKLFKTSAFKRSEKLATVSHRKRIISSVVLLGLIMFYIPYQFGFIICSIIQIIATLSSHVGLLEPSPKDKLDEIKKNGANYNSSLLILMIWIIPVNVPVLIVFFHNLTVRWKTPFSSHHNILAILPILFLVVKNLQGEITVRAGNQLQKRVTTLILLYFAYFSLIYGIRHLYWLHYLLNLLSSWLFIVSLWS